jgi:fumarylacetoacetate (FAA) hydrolase
MKLATLNDGTRDGSLLIVGRDNAAWTSAGDIAATLQDALDRWDEVEPALKRRAAALDSGEIAGEPVDVARLRSPLPRAYEWIDGSAYINHIVLVRKARNADPPATLETDPLVYQGGSGVLLDPTSDIVLRDPEHGLDFEAELCVILGDTPIGTTADEAWQHVKLMMLCNDITLRNLIPPELAKSFGFFVSKPATAFSPFAITPDELGDALQDGRIHLNLRTTLNREVAGDVAAGPEMHFSFNELIQHICRTRAFVAGTILGSGTVSNIDESAGVSCLAERRMREIIATGAPSTRFLKAGDHVEITMRDDAGRDLFGTISQRVVSA